MLPALAMLLVACPIDAETPEPSPTGKAVYVPEAAAIVRSAVLTDASEGRDMSVRLSSGIEVTVDLNDTTRLRDRAPDVGDLFFYGQREGERWFLAIPGRDPTCYIVEGYATDVGEAIEFDFGLRLPKAADFDPGSVSGGRFANPAGPQFCVNAEGEVLFLRE
jgi:hypothetical protein